jgi:protein-disulfide isomerase
VPLLEQVLEKNPEKVKLVFKNFPLRNHQYAAKAARAAIAADAKGKFWQFHDRLFENYNRLNDKKINDIALALRLDQTEFAKQMKSPQMRSRIERDILDGTRAGVKSTPTVFVNGRHLKNRTLKGFQALIDKELQKIEKTPN